MAKSRAAEKPKDARDWRVDWPPEMVWQLTGVKPHPDNPKVHPAAQVTLLADILKTVGPDQPIVVDEEGVILKGHGRRLAALEAGFDDFPVVQRFGLSEVEKIAMRIADNQVSLLGGWNQKLLAPQTVALKAAGFNTSTLGFTNQQLRRWDTKSVPKASDDDEVPEAPKRPTARPGDLWVLGRHRLLCGDTFDPADVGTLMHGKTADMVATDPPYAIYGSSTGIGADIADDKMVRPFFEKLGGVIAQSLKEFGHAYVCCDWRSYATLWHGMKFAQLAPKNCIVWDKGSAGLGANYANTHEFVAYFAKLPPRKAMQSSDQRGQRTVNAPNIFRVNRVTGEERQHNAAKPVELLVWLIGNGTDTGEIVVDFFAGSGSTIIAAEQSDRICYAMEMEPRHIDVCITRWQRKTGGSAMLDGKSFERVQAERKKAPA